ncbi:MAG TPA: exodeoxyribonuclease III, partial [Acidimicrobiales bacterium]
MKLATWNVNSLNARWERVASWLSEHEPDVLLVQETKQSDEKFPFAPLAALGYESAHYGQGQWNGVAILSRLGVEEVVRGFGDDDPEARFIGATCAGVRVYSCYVPNGRALDDPHYTYKLEWLAKLARVLDQRDRAQSVVVGGDFNVAPTDFDCYD